MSISSDRFPTEVAGLPPAGAPEVVELADGTELDLLIGREPLTAGVEGWLSRDDHGCLVTVGDLRSEKVTVSLVHTYLDDPRRSR